MAFNTPPAKLQQLRDKLLLFLSQNSRDYTPKLEITLTSIIDKSTLQVQMGLEHKGNWADGKKKAIRRNAFMHALKDGIIEFDIELCGGVDVTLVGGYNGDILRESSPSESSPRRSSNGSAFATGDTTASGLEGDITRESVRQRASLSMTI